MKPIARPIPAVLAAVRVALVVSLAGSGAAAAAGADVAGDANGLWHGFFAVDPLETPYVGDFNGDGRTDVITFTRQNPRAVGDVYVALSDGTQFVDRYGRANSSDKWHDWFAINTDESVVIGDFDADGRDDIATWLATTTRQVYVALSYGTGMAHESVWANSIGFGPSDVLASGDVNGDRRQDLVLFARSQGKVYVALSDGTRFGTPTVWHGFFAVSTYERPRVADVNGDGRADSATFCTDSPTAFGDVYVALSDGSRFVDLNGVAGSSTKWHDWFAIDPNEEIRVGDADGDGASDFFTFLPPSRGGQCYSVRSERTAMGPNVLCADAVRLDERDRVFVGDVDGDRKADIVLFAQGGGKVYVGASPNRPKVDRRRPFAPSSPWNTLTPAGTQWYDTPLLHACSTCAGGTRHWWVNTDVGIVWASASDPVWTFDLPGYTADLWHRTRAAATVRMHAPRTLTPHPDDDRIVLVADPVSGEYVELWSATTDPASLTVTGPVWATGNLITGLGVGDLAANLNGGVRASNFSWGAGLITQADLSAGTIDHALALALPSDMTKGGSAPVGPYRAPATCGNGAWPTGPIVMGSKVGIPAGTPRPAGLSPIGVMVFDALQRYGAYVGDVLGGEAPAFYADGPSLGLAPGTSIDDTPFEPLVAFWSHAGSADMEKIVPLLRVADYQP